MHELLNIPLSQRSMVIVAAYYRRFHQLFI